MGGYSRHAIPASLHLSRSHLCLSSGFHRCSLITSTLIWRYPPPPRPARTARPPTTCQGIFISSVYQARLGGGILFRSKDKAGSDLFVRVAPVKLTFAGIVAPVTRLMDSRGFVGTRLAVFWENCPRDICDLLITMSGKITCICKVAFVVVSPPPSLCSQRLSLSVSPSSLYPLPLHSSIMETLESFTSLLSIMSFKLFPYFLFLTSLLFFPPLLSL